MPLRPGWALASMYNYMLGSTDKRILCKTQVNDKSTAGRFDPKVLVNCVQDTVGTIL